MEVDWLRRGTCCFERRWVFVQSGVEYEELPSAGYHFATVVFLSGYLFHDSFLVNKLNKTKFPIVIFLFFFCEGWIIVRLQKSEV